MEASIAFTHLLCNQARICRGRLDLGQQVSELLLRVTDWDLLILRTRVLEALGLRTGPRFR